MGGDSPLVSVQSGPQDNAKLLWMRLRQRDELRFRDARGRRFPRAVGLLVDDKRVAVSGQDLSREGGV